MEPSIDFAQFSEQLRTALNRIFDLAYLERHPLCRSFFPEPAIASPSRAERLRRVILETIEELSPPDQVQINTREWRSYHILCGRYIEKMTPSEMMQELALSERQFFREQRGAVDGLVALLWEKYLSMHLNRRGLAETVDDISEPEMVQEETEGLVSLPETLGVTELVDGVLRTLEPLCRERGVQVSCSAAHSLPPLHVSRVVARQILIQPLSQLIVQTSARRLRIDLSRGHSQVIVRVVGSWDREPSGDLYRSLALDTARQMLADARGRWLGLDLSEQGFSMGMSLPTTLPRVILAVEDNPGAVQLLRRYLARTDYRVVEASSGQGMISLVESTDPDLILLDIMLPGRDGWEVLHELRSNPRTNEVPVLVCSVLDEYELARAMGASAYLKKPYARSQLIDTLNRL